MKIPAGVSLFHLPLPMGALGFWVLMYLAFIGPGDLAPANRLVAQALGLSGPSLQSKLPTSVSLLP